MGGSRTRSGEQGQAAQRRAAHGPIGLGVAAKRSSGCALGPLRGRGAKHPSAGSGFRGLPGQAGRDPSRAGRPRPTAPGRVTADQGLIGRLSRGL